MQNQTFRDYRHHFKSIELKDLANTHKQHGQCFAIYRAFACYLEPREINPSNKSGRAVTLPFPLPLHSP